MAYVSDNPNFTEKSENDISSIEDNDRKSAENSPTDIKKASKLANLLEGLSFPANKEKIKDHLNRFLLLWEIGLMMFWKLFRII
jgi:hypothetical protein